MNADDYVRVAANLVLCYRCVDELYETVQRRPLAQHTMAVDPSLRSPDTPGAAWSRDRDATPAIAALLAAAFESRDVRAALVKVFAERVRVVSDHRVSYRTGDEVAEWFASMRSQDRIERIRVGEGSIICKAQSDVPYYRLVVRDERIDEVRSYRSALAAYADVAR
jgi:hypothetical protein